MNHAMTGQVAARSIHKPAPRAFCRAELIKGLVRRCEARTFVDVGCGDGYISERLAEMGLTGLALDVSPQAVEITSKRLQSRGFTNVAVRQADLFRADLPEKRADVVLFLEVLEHLEDDIAGLERLRYLVHGGGWLILSVPAQAKLWDALDEWAGHIRRYARDELVEKLQVTGWQPMALYNYGFPLINLTRPLRRFHHARRNRRAGWADSASPQESTFRSGTSADGYVSGLGWLWSAYGRLATLLQRPFLNRDLGEGYLVSAQRIPDR